MRLCCYWLKCGKRRSGECLEPGRAKRSNAACAGPEASINAHHKWSGSRISSIIAYSRFSLLFRADFRFFPSEPYESGHNTIISVRCVCVCECCSFACSGYSFRIVIISFASILLFAFVKLNLVCMLLLCCVFIRINQNINILYNMYKLRTIFLMIFLRFLFAHRFSV